MSSILAVTYEGMAAVTASDTAADPAGPFAALYFGATGTIKITTVTGLTVSGIPVVAGTTLHIATQRVWTGGAASVYGLTANPYRPH